VIAGIGIRFWRLGRQSLWFDEGYTAWFVAHPPDQILRLVRADTAPPLYYFLLHQWTRYFGNSEAGLRSLSALFSSLTLILAVPIARRILVTPGAVALAVWLLAVGFHQPYYAQEARGYALMVLLFIAAVDCLQRHLTDRDRRRLVPISLLLAAALYTHNIMMAYLPAFFGAWLVFPSEHSFSRRVQDIGLTIFSMALLYSPWALFGLPAQLHLVGQGFWVKPPGTLDVLTLLGWLFDVPPYFSWNHFLARTHIPLQVHSAPVVFGSLLIAASLAITFSHVRGTRLRNAFGLAFLVLAPFVLVTVYSLLRTPLLMDKLFLPSAALAPVLLIFPLSVELSRAARRAVLAGAMVVLLISLSTLVAYETVQKKEDWRGAARFVQALPPAQRLIAFVANDGQLPFDYYYHYLPDDEVTGVPAGFFDLDPPRAMMRLQSEHDLDGLRARLAAGSFDEVILVVSHVDWADPLWLTERLLEQTCREEARKRIDSEITIVQFEPQSSGPRYAGSHQLTSTAVASSDRFSVPAN
jgi:hypothetical protein